MRYVNVVSYVRDRSLSATNIVPQRSKESVFQAKQDDGGCNVEDSDDSIVLFSHKFTERQRLLAWILQNCCVDRDDRDKLQTFLANVVEADRMFRNLDSIRRGKGD